MCSYDGGLMVVRRCGVSCRFCFVWLLVWCFVVAVLLGFMVCSMYRVLLILFKWWIV